MKSSNVNFENIERGIKSISKLGLRSLTEFDVKGKSMPIKTKGVFILENVPSGIKTELGRLVTGDPTAFISFYGTSVTFSKNLRRKVLNITRKHKLSIA